MISMAVFTKVMCEMKVVYEAISIEFNHIVN